MTSIWAHRGASADAPENTMAAFELAVRQGADGIELDVQRAADGTLVVIHDETVDRTTNGSGRIVDMVWGDLRGLDASGGNPDFAGERLPQLADVLDLLSGTDLWLNIELKDGAEHYPGMDRQVVEAVVAARMHERVVLSSFNHVQLAGTVAARTGLPVGLLYVEQLWRVEQYAAAFGAAAVHPDFHSLSEPGLVERLQTAGIAVNAWTVNEPDDLRAMFTLGIDAVITDVPALARQVRQER